jgi:hypothetical protein
LVLGKVSLRVLLLSPVSIIPPQLSILMCHLGLTIWWQQFRDIDSPYRHKHEQSPKIIIVTERSDVLVYMDTASCQCI